MAQREVDAKTNEIPEPGPTLEGLHLAGMVVTADARHGQRDTNTPGPCPGTPQTPKVPDVADLPAGLGDYHSHNAVGFDARHHCLPGEFFAQRPFRARLPQ
jgi:hypothetical protein